MARMGKREVSRHGHRTITAEVGLCDDRTLETLQL
jgi:hypothetical protein